MLDDAARLARAAPTTDSCSPRKRARARRRRARKPLDAYRAEELAEMSRDIFDDRHGFADARRAFVTKRPASEAKAEVDVGEPFDPASLSFRRLAPTREAVLDGMIEVSGQPDALRRLGVRPSLERLVRDNTALREAPAADAASVYDGTLYHAIGRTIWTSTPSRRRRGRRGRGRSRPCGARCGWTTGSRGTGSTCAAGSPTSTTSRRCGSDRSTRLWRTSPTTA